MQSDKNVDMKNPKLGGVEGSKAEVLHENQKNETES